MQYVPSLDVEYSYSYELQLSFPSLTHLVCCKLNDATMIASYQSPNITNTLERIAGASYFTAKNMTSWHHQFEVVEEMKKKRFCLAV